MGGVTGGISFKSNVSATLRNLRSEQSKLRENTKRISSTLKSAQGIPRKLKADVSDTARVLKHAMDATKKTKPVMAAVKARDIVTKVIKDAGAVPKIVGGPVTVMLKAKDTAPRMVKKTAGALDRPGRKMVPPVVEVVDKTGEAIKGIVGRIGKVAKATTIPVGTTVVAGTAVLGVSVSAGIQLEQQQIPVEHFAGATNKELSQADVKAQPQSCIQQLRENADVIPFETGEVIQVGLKAISLIGESITDAMNLVALAEDMATASGGTASIMDTTEVLGDLKVREAEQLKSFGFKASAEEFRKRGSSGTSGEFQDLPEGAAGKPAGPGAGLMSTITSKMRSNTADLGLGVAKQLKPVLSEAIGLMDKV